MRRPPPRHPSIALFLFIVVALLTPACAAQPPRLKSNTIISRIAFGSCAKQDKPQPIWDSILAAKPDVFLFIGDNIYGDSEDIAVLKAKWDQLGAVPGYQRIRNTCPILATWDDHDFGVNDGGADYPKKVESQALFLDFFDEPADSPRRERKGIYDAKIVGPTGKRVQFILLDTRYHRSPLKKKPVRIPGDNGPYLPDDDPAATMLGQEQWAWLEAQLRQPADVRIVASSVQFVAEEHNWEGWLTFPRERQRLLQLIRDTRTGGVVFISGDRHKAEISRLAPQNTTVGYPLYDVTSSSLNQPSQGALDEPNRHRVGSEQMYGPVNFGIIEIDWSKPDPAFSMQVRDIDGNIVIRADDTLNTIR